MNQTDDSNDDDIFYIYEEEEYSETVQNICLCHHEIATSLTASLTMAKDCLEAH